MLTLTRQAVRQRSLEHPARMFSPQFAYVFKRFEFAARTLQLAGGENIAELFQALCANDETSPDWYGSNYRVFDKSNDLPRILPSNLSVMRQVHAWR